MTARTAEGTRTQCPEKLLKVILDVSDPESLAVVFRDGWGRDQVDQVFDGSVDYLQALDAGLMMRDYGKTPDEFRANLGAHMRQCRRCKRVYHMQRAGQAEEAQRDASRMMLSNNPATRME